MNDGIDDLQDGGSKVEGEQHAVHGLIAESTELELNEIGSDTQYCS